MENVGTVNGCFLIGYFKDELRLCARNMAKEEAKASTLIPIAGNISLGEVGFRVARRYLTTKPVAMLVVVLQMHF